MRTVASFIFTSLDGFYEGPNHELDFLPIDAEFNEQAVAQLDGADVLGFGRATYEVMAAYWPTELSAEDDTTITSRMNQKPKFVFSRSLTHPEWSGTVAIRGEATELLPTIDAGTDKDLLIMGSAQLTAELAQAGLLDELRIMICPVLLGQGHSLFEHLRDRISLELLQVRRFSSGNLSLTYRPLPNGALVR